MGQKEPHPKGEAESMFHLLASKPPRRGKREAATLVTSIALHGAVAAGLIWATLQTIGSAAAGLFFVLYIVATTVLFAGVPWSKFAHMFFKPAAAFDKRVQRANGTAENLPTQTRDDPEQRTRHSMELLRDAPMDMGLGIKREAPRHY